MTTTNTKTDDLAVPAFLKRDSKAKPAPAPMGKVIEKLIADTQKEVAADAKAKGTTADKLIAQAKVAGKLPAKPKAKAAAKAKAKVAAKGKKAKAKKPAATRPEPLPKVELKAKGAQPVAMREGSKQAMQFAALIGPKGATRDELCKITGFTPGTQMSALHGSRMDGILKKMKAKLVAEDDDKRGRVYRVIAK